jgi:AcrR family transcriptional regulator
MRSGPAAGTRPCPTPVAPPDGLGVDYRAAAPARRAVPSCGLPRLWFQFHVNIANVKVGVKRRPYRMVARAEAAAVTAERILDAAAEVFWELPTDEISLDEVARRAGVTVQTVIRRFGGREGLMVAATERETERVSRQRAEAPVGDPVAAIRVLVEHYEAMGDGVLKMLAEEKRVAALGPIVNRGRALHRDWCSRVFGPVLEGLSGADHERRLAQLVAVCDVYTWKLLRRDSGLSRRQTELATVELLRPLLEGS